MDWISVSQIFMYKQVSNKIVHNNVDGNKKNLTLQSMQMSLFFTSVMTTLLMLDENPLEKLF